jgi:hypothetical protein
MKSRLERGSCFCGAIAAEIEGEPFFINYDHDDDCRKALGSPLTIWIGYRVEQVHFVRGTVKSFSKTAGIQRTFCAECGSSIGYADQGLKDEIWLTIGFMDQPKRFEPQAHGYWRLKLPWIDFADHLPRFETYTQRRDPLIGYPVDRKDR